MNMLKQFLVFERLQEVNGLTPGQCRLWYALMYIDNLTGWQDWFTVASLTLENRCRMSKNGLLKARKGLVELGYLEVQNNGRKAPAYHLVDLMQRYSSPSMPTTTEVSPQDEAPATKPTITKAAVDAPQSNQPSRSLPRPQTSATSAPLSKQETKQKQTNQCQTSDDQLTTTKSFLTWTQNWDRPSIYVQNQLGQWIQEFGDELVNFAIEAALSRMVSNAKAYSYLTKVFQSYRDKGITSVTEAEAEREQHRDQYRQPAAPKPNYQNWRRPRRVEKRPACMTENKEVKITTPEQEAEVKRLLAALHEQEKEPAKTLAG